MQKGKPVVEGGMGIDERIPEENALGEPSGDQDQVAPQTKGI